MHSSRILGPLLALGIASMAGSGLAGCGSGLRVETDWNPQRTDVVRAWRTWAWLDGQGSYDDLDDVRIREAISRNLTGRGFTLASSPESADFLVAHQLAIEQELVVHDTPYYAGWYGSVRPWYEPAYVDQVQFGVLVVDLVDRASNELLWRGVAESPALSRIDGPERRRARLHEAVDEMFAEFPFRRGPAAPPARSATPPPTGT